MNGPRVYQAASIPLFLASCFVASCAAQPPPPAPVPLKLTIDRSGLWDNADDPMPPKPTSTSATAVAENTSSTWYCFYIAKAADDDYGACRHDEARCNALSEAVPGDDKLPCALRVPRIKTIFHFTVVRSDNRELDVGTLTQRSCEWWRDSFQTGGYRVARDRCHGEAAK